MSEKKYYGHAVTHDILIQQVHTLKKKKKGNRI